MRTIASVIAAGLVAGAASTPASADTYAVETGVAGVVDMYNLSSVERTRGGFSIWEVVVSDRLPTIFGPVAYRVIRADYECATGRYDITVLREFDRDGKLLNAIKTPPQGGMEVVAATASGEMYNRFCEPSQRGVQVTGLPPELSVEQDSEFAAYRFGQKRLSEGRP